MKELRIGIPVINRGDLLANCVASIDVPVECLLIIANRWDEEYEPSVLEAIERLEAKPPQNVGLLQVHRIDGNLGVAGSFNRIIETLGPCVVASDDCYFEPGALLECISYMDLHQDNALHHLFAMVAFGVTQQLIDEIGYFDENLWPWGWDDIDLFYRLGKHGLKRGNLPNGRRMIRHDHPTQSMNSSPRSLKWWMKDLARKNTAYGERKWAIKEDYHFMLHPKDQWAIDVSLLKDAGDAWKLDLKERERRLKSLFDATGVKSNLVFSRLSNFLD